MTVEKVKVVDQIEVTEIGAVQVRTAFRVVEDGVVIAQSHHRHVVSPGDDYSAEDERVQAICAVTHTADVIEAYKSAITAFLS